MAIILLSIGLEGCDQMLGPAPLTKGDSVKQVAGKKKYSGTQTNTKSSINSNDPAANGEDASFLDLLATEKDGNLWDRLRHEFQIPCEEDRPQVRAQIAWFMQHQGYLDRTVKRAAPYMYYIYEQVHKRKLPAELVLLPVNESAYNPFASSSVGAAGVWQLMPRTAYGFGVKQNFWYDGRRDIYASTNAALDYLTYLHNYFGGDWLLAIAAYDTGEGNVQIAIRRNAKRDQNTDFWSLSLAQETLSYVPRLLALACIIRNPAKYHITLPPISDKPYLAQVDVGAPIDLERAAQLAGMSLVHLKQLNPGYNRKTIDPTGPYKLILPIDRIALFRERLAKAPTLPRTIWGRYKVQRGDSLANIARRYHTSVSEIKQANHLKGAVAPVGKIIMIPTGTAMVTLHPSSDQGSDQSETTTAIAQTIDTASAIPTVTAASDTITETAVDEQAELAPAPIKPELQKRIHVIKRGESLMAIARQYKVKVSDLQRWNKLTSKPLKIGSKLVIWSKSVANSNSTAPVHTAKTNKAKPKQVAAKKPTIRPDHYVVKAGDNLYAIARRLGVKSADLAKWNGLASNAPLKPGQRLVVR